MLLLGELPHAEGFLEFEEQVLLGSDTIRRHLSEIYIHLTVFELFLMDQFNDCLLCFKVVIWLAEVKFILNQFKEHFGLPVRVVLNGFNEAEPLLELEKVRAALNQG